MGAVNDAELLEYSALQSLSHFVQQKSYAHPIISLVTTCIFETTLGEYIDGAYCYLQSSKQPPSPTRLQESLTLKHFTDICEMKTGVYTFFMPVACGCYCSGLPITPEFLQDLRVRCLSIGVIFQAAVWVFSVLLLFLFYSRYLVTSSPFSPSILTFYLLPPAGWYTRLFWRSCHNWKSRHRYWRWEVRLACSQGTFPCFNCRLPTSFTVAGNSITITDSWLSYRKHNDGMCNLPSSFFHSVFLCYYFNSSSLNSN